MTWDTFHRRGDVLRAVISEVNANCDGQLPMHLPGVAETFADELDLLGSLQLRWHTMLAGRIEVSLGEQPVDLEQAVIGAWRASADALPGIRRVLDHHRESPQTNQIAQALLNATAKEHHMMALMAGRASRLDLEVAGARAGAAIERRAREGYVLPTADTTTGRGSFIDRIRAALVA